MAELGIELLLHPLMSLLSTIFHLTLYMKEIQLASILNCLHFLYSLSVILLKMKRSTIKTIMMMLMMMKEMEGGANPENYLVERQFLGRMDNLFRRSKVKQEGNHTTPTVITGDQGQVPGMMMTMTMMIIMMRMKMETRQEKRRREQKEEGGRMQGQ